MTTGKEASNTVVEEKWAPSFLYGLVPATVDVSDECTNGIASAERKFSFLNMVVSTLTANIFSPQSVTVTCAAEGMGMSSAVPPAPGTFTLPTDASNAEAQDVLSTATLQSSISQDPVQIHIVEK